MFLKEKIHEMLLNLKKLGFERKTIEKDLGYAANFITRNLSQGGTEKFLEALEKYYIKKTNSKIDDPLYATIDERVTALEIQNQVIIHYFSEKISKITGEPLTSTYLELQKLLAKEIKRSHEA
jgi:hypothetical protein